MAWSATPAPDGRDAASARAAEVLARAADQRRRAAAAAARAIRQELVAARAMPSRRRLLDQAARLHRQTQAHHEAVAGLHEAYATALLGGNPPAHPLVSAVGEVLGELGVAVHLVSSQGLTVASLAADPLARACRDLEDVLGEGPGTDAVAARSTVSASIDTPGRWPRFAPAARERGVRSAAALPLDAGKTCVGAVTIYSSERTPPPEAAGGDLSDVSSAVLVLLLEEAFPAGLEVDRVGAEDYVVVHQASGVVAHRLGISLADAVALLRAGAFARDMPLAELCARVLADHSLLD